MTTSTESALFCRLSRFLPSSLRNRWRRRLGERMKAEALSAYLHGNISVCELEIARIWVDVLLSE